MCANYLPADRDTLARFALPPPDFEYGEAYPGAVVPVVTNHAPRQWVPACFGLIPGWAKDVKIARSTYNARSETVGDKPSFRAAWRHGQLCIIPATAFFEPCYESGKAVRWRIGRRDGRPMGLAGIWQHHGEDSGLPAWSVAMLTINADAHPLLQRFHRPEDEKRSVVILPDAAWRDWLRARSEAEARALLQPFPADALQAEPAPRPPSMSLQAGQRIRV